MVFHNAIPFYYHHQQGFHFFHIFANTYYFLFFNIHRANGCERYLSVLFICISLVISYVKILFMCLFAICIPPLEKYLFTSYAHFLTQFFFFFLLLSLGVLCIICLFIHYHMYGLQLFTLILYIAFLLCWHYLLMDKNFMTLICLFIIHLNFSYAMELFVSFLSVPSFL